MSRPITCIVLDGWHKGHTVVLPGVQQTISLLKPKTITIDDCCDGEMVGVDRDLRKDYRLAFVSVDQEIALYTVDGTSKAITQRDWITPANKNWVEEPLFVGIHDPRSVINYATIEEQP